LKVGTNDPSSYYTHSCLLVSIILDAGNVRVEKNARRKKIGEKPWVCWGSSFTIENKVILACQNEKEGLMSALTLIFNNSLPLAKNNSIVVIYPHFKYPCYESNTPLL
jgi:hypothetical protein